MSFRSWLYFTLSMLAVLWIFAGFFNAFTDDAAILDQLLKNFPPEFKAAFGFADVNLSEIDGYFSFLIAYVVLIGAVYGMKLGVDRLSEEGRRMTSDFLLTRPVRRDRIVTGKLAAVLICLAAQNLLVFLSGYASIHMLIDEPMDMGLFALMILSILLVQLFFAGIGFLIAAIAQKIKSVTPIALGVVFFFFIIELVNESLLDKNLTYVTPFAYFKGSGIIENRAFDPVYTAIDLAVFAVCVILAYRIFQKKDIRSV